MKPYFFPEGDSRGTYAMLVSDLLDTDPIQVGEWQAMDVSKSDLHKTYELEDVSLVWDRVPSTEEGLLTMIPHVDMLWAGEHFDERVSGTPYNPAPSHVRWPYAVRGNTDHTTGQRFDHTYPERFWPKYAGANIKRERANVGVRFNYGDLSDVVDLLARSPLTRQAYLPVWFPEDTGAVDGQRVPCTLGYHFMQRGGRLSMRYYLRSCDVYRHLSNDVYLAASLLEWVCNRVTTETSLLDTPMHFRPGSLTMHISSLHSFVGDRDKVEKRLADL